MDERTRREHALQRAALAGDADAWLTLYDDAICLLQRGGCPADPDLAAAQRGRAAALRQRDSAA